jgi:hypothetical protein
LNWLFGIAGIENLVEEFDDLLSAKLNNANAATHQSLLYHREALLDLAAVFFKLLNLFS